MGPDDRIPVNTSFAVDTLIGGHVELTYDETPAASTGDQATTPGTCSNPKAAIDRDRRQATLPSQEHGELRQQQIHSTRSQHRRCRHHTFRPEQLNERTEPTPRQPAGVTGLPPSNQEPVQQLLGEIDQPDRLRCHPPADMRHQPQLVGRRQRRVTRRRQLSQNRSARPSNGPCTTTTGTRIPMLLLARVEQEAWNNQPDYADQAGLNPKRHNTDKTTVGITTRSA